MSYASTVLGDPKTNDDGHLHCSRQLTHPYLRPTSESDHHPSPDWRKLLTSLHLTNVSSCCCCCQNVDSSTLAEAGRKFFVGWEEKCYKGSWAGHMNFRKLTPVSDHFVRTRGIVHGEEVGH